MIIGLPKEIKDHEARVGLVPSGVAALREAGHEVLVETSAGEGSSLTDREYMQAGAAIVERAAALWRGADLVVKEKEPEPTGAGGFAGGRSGCGPRQRAHPGRRRGGSECGQNCGRHGGARDHH